MKHYRMNTPVVLGAALVIAGCTDQNTPTDLQDQSGPSFDVAAALTSTVIDPIGDAVWNQNKGPGSFAKVPAWMDIVSASISRRGQWFIIEEELAAPVPNDPSLDPDIPPQIDHVAFAGYGLDTDPTTAPVGYPFNKNDANFAEFYLLVAWNPTGSFGVGTGFIGLLNDRRPLLTGGEATIVPVEFSIQGTHIRIVVDAAALGDPSSFAWAAFTHLAQHPHPPDTPNLFDVAPDLNLGLAPWPQ